MIGYGADPAPGADECLRTALAVWMYIKAETQRAAFAESAIGSLLGTTPTRPTRPSAYRSETRTADGKE